MVKQAASTEETINKQLEDLIQETSQAEEHLTQGPIQELESGTLYESHIPADSFRRPVRAFPGGLVTSTPAAGPGAAATSFGTAAGGNKLLTKYRTYLLRLFKVSFRKCIFLAMFASLVLNSVFYNFITSRDKSISFPGKI